MRLEKNLSPATANTATTSVPSEKPSTPEGSFRGGETVRIRLDLLDELMMLAGELVLVRNQQLMSAFRADPASRAVTQRLDVVTSALQETVMRTRMQPVGSILGKFQRITRDLGAQLNKQIQLETSGNEVELDKTILEGLADPLTHIVRNSCDHGIEIPEERIRKGKNPIGNITIRAFHEGGQMNVVVSDDGRGIDVEAVRKLVLERGLKTADELAQLSPKEIVSIIFLPGFSTAKKVSEVSGRGVGMDVVKTSIERLGGSIDIDTEKDVGTQILLRLPLTLAIIPSLIVRSRDQQYAIPQINLEELVCLYDEDIRKIECVGNREVYRLRDMLLPMIRLEEIFAHPEAFREEDAFAITEKYQIITNNMLDDFRLAKTEGKSAGISFVFAVLKVGNRRFGLAIDKVVGSEEIVVKPAHPSVKHLSIYAGATVLGDGSVALILDALGIARHAGIEFNNPEEKESLGTASGDQRKSLLLFRSGSKELFAVDTSQVKRIERFSCNKVETVGHREFYTVDGRSTRIIRLEDHIQVSSCEQKNEMFLLLPQESEVPCGLLVSQVVDIGSFAYNLDTSSFQGSGVLGSAIIRNQMTIILDLNQFIRQANASVMEV